MDKNSILAKSGNARHVFPLMPSLYPKSSERMPDTLEKIPRLGPTLNQIPNPKLSDVIKLNESELKNTDLNMWPNKAENSFVSNWFCNPSTARIFETNWPIWMGSVVNGSFANSVFNPLKNENWIWPTPDSFCLTYYLNRFPTLVLVQSREIWGFGLPHCL